MAFSMDFGTGFEMASVEIVSDSERNNLAIDTRRQTGSYGLEIRNYNPDAWVDFQVSGTPSDFYLAVWVYPTATGGVDNGAYGYSNKARIYLYLDDGTISLRLDNNHWDLHVSGSQVAAGSVSIEDDWHHVQLHISVADSGLFETKIDGIDDISYSGDTAPGSSTGVNEVRFWTDGDSINNAWGIDIDDLCFGIGGWPGDIRFEALVPNADTATIDWTGSDGNQVDNYALVDETGPSSADYVESVLTGDQDKYNLEDFVATNKDPLAVALWAYAKKDEAAAHQLKLILDDGTEDVGAAQDLLTSYTYLHRLDLTKPSGGDWTDAALDALEAGVESVIV